MEESRVVVADTNDSIFNTLLAATDTNAFYPKPIMEKLYKNNYGNVSVSCQSFMMTFQDPSKVDNQNSIIIINIHIKIMCFGLQLFYAFLPLFSICGLRSISTVIKPNKII